MKDLVSNSIFSFVFSFSIRFNSVKRPSPQEFLCCTLPLDCETKVLYLTHHSVQQGDIESALPTSDENVHRLTANKAINKTCHYA